MGHSHGRKQIWLIYLKKYDNKTKIILRSFTIKKSFTWKKKNLKKFIKTQKIDDQFFENNKKIIIEIGPGTGDNIIFLSKKYPRKKIIGIEPFKNGLANIAHTCVENNIKNIYLFPFVFQKFLSKFNNHTFHQCYIFFPDPWPKKKHNKRRLVTYQFLKELSSRCLRKGAIFIASDNLDYFKSVKKHVNTLKKEVKLSVKFSKKTPTIVTKYHNRAIKLKNNINFLKIDKI